jgi:copper chaperone CopZ
MQDKYQEDRIQDSLYFDLAKADFWIKSVHENEPPVAAVIDSFFWRFPKGDYIWDKLLRDTIKANGFQYHSVWSIDWWKYPEKTPQQLMDFIKIYDAEFSLAEEVEEIIPVLDEVDADSVISEVDSFVDEIAADLSLDDVEKDDNFDLNEIQDAEKAILEMKIEKNISDDFIENNEIQTTADLPERDIISDDDNTL